MIDLFITASAASVMAKAICSDHQRCITTAVALLNNFDFNYLFFSFSVFL